jgi:hypothetical protein
MPVDDLHVRICSGKRTQLFQAYIPACGSRPIPATGRDAVLERLRPGEVARTAGQ